MSQTLESRTFVMHVSGLFDADMLRDIRAYLDAVEVERRVLVQTERERIAIANGTFSDLVRMDMRWYDVWRHNTAHIVNPLGNGCQRWC